MTMKAIHGSDKRIQITPEEVKKTGEADKWYEGRINIPAGAQTLLEQYSGFASHQIAPHVKDLVRALVSPMSQTYRPQKFPSVANRL